MDQEPLPNLFVHIARTVIAVFPMFILFALLITALDYFIPDSNSSNAFIPIFVAYFLHRFVLFQPAGWLRWNKGQKNGHPMPPEYIGRFVGASLIVGALLVVVGIFVAVPLHDQLDRNEVEGVFLLVFGLISWLYLSLFGMQFPAMAAGRRFSMIDPLRATWANRGRIAIALLLVSGTLWLCALIAIVFIDRMIFGMQAGWDPAISNAMSAFIGSLIGVIPSVATVVILSRGYIRHYPRQVPAEHGDSVPPP